MRAVFACLLLMGLFAACQRRGTAPELEASGEEPDTATVAAADEHPDVPDVPAASDEPSSNAGGSGAVTDEVEGEPPSTEAPGSGAASNPQEEPPTARDLAAELSAAIGSPTDCTADFQRATPATIRVSVSALVRPSGAVTQASATGTGLTLLARQCIARQAETVVLRPLEAGVSERVSAVVEIEYVPPSSTVAGVQAGAPDPQLRNVREPLPPRPEAAPSGRPIQDPTSRPIQEPTARPIQEPSSRKVRGPQPRPIDGWDVDESSKDWR